ncbi:uncharacterized protein PgNI_03090 [Pyricularia grisea]|uniref:Uncharacterized protein n=1 Tax=Pyricularia grisea TaxID=148305 RepID=A0A6P8B853_PYRGI|nr:uncharacterized protein PgNI_03090 [Pyricularia grisea]TLD11993.1 hypothetical protein PgNI_03090 [Pyricularia grisea]
MRDANSVYYRKLKELEETWESRKAYEDEKQILMKDPQSQSELDSLDRRSYVLALVYCDRILASNSNFR